MNVETARLPVASTSRPVTGAQIAGNVFGAIAAIEALFSLAVALMVGHEAGWHRMIVFAGPTIPFALLATFLGSSKLRAAYVCSIVVAVAAFLMAA